MDFTLTEAQQELAALLAAHPDRSRDAERLRGLSEDRFDPRCGASWRPPAAACDAAELGLLDQCSVLVEFGPGGGAGALPELDRGGRVDAAPLRRQRPARHVGPRGRWPASS